MTAVPEPSGVPLETIARKVATDFWGECAEDPRRPGWCEAHQCAFGGQVTCTLVCDSIDMAQKAAREWAEQQRHAPNAETRP